jgi:predicted nuclease of predicted toxin-antitoxin system
LKLLFDANLSPKLANRLSELFPGSIHVFDTGLAQFTSDQAIWEYAGASGFTIVTADSDFIDLHEFSAHRPGWSVLRTATIEQPKLRNCFDATPF